MLPFGPTTAQRASNSLTWLKAVGVGLLALLTTQLIIHRAAVSYPRLWYHVVTGGLEAILVFVPIVLYLNWRRSFFRLRRSETMRQDLLHMLVHDLKNPLGAAMLALNIIVRRRQQSGQGDADELQMLQIAEESGRRLMSMISDILDVGQAEAGALRLRTETVHLNDIVREALAASEPHSQRSKTAIYAELAENMPPLQLDRDKIRRVIDNLLDNAFKFTPTGGVINVTTERVEGSLRLTIQNSGQAIPEELREVIFQKYAQLEAARAGYRGSVGLGLTFSRLVVEAHGGRIWAHSPPEGGAAFTVSLPLPPGSLEHAS